MHPTPKVVNISKLILVIYYIVGAVGMALPQTSVLVKSLTPYTLLMTIVLLAFFHQTNVSLRTIIVLGSIAFIGFLAEMVGVNTGIIFGNYQYGSGLGIKLSNTPLLIALNWLFLVYTTSSVVDTFSLAKVWRVLIPSAIMLAYDLVLEQIAPTLNMWRWENDVIPFQNYLAWFALSVFFHGLIVVFKVKTTNPLSLTVLTTQWLFLVFVYFALT
jgi:bisanhydrobacterioruberin hydratase